MKPTPPPLPKSGWLWCGLLLVCVGNWAAAANLSLARGGKPVATIVVPANAPERVILAATELQRYVQRRCLVELPIRRDGKAVANTGLYLGPCEPSRPSDLPDPALNPEAYAVRVRDGNVFLTGRYPTATYFATVSFIEDALGVRWFAPGEDWEYVPPATPGELSIEPREMVKAPDTSPRFWSGHNFGSNWVTWGLRNKTINSDRAPRRNFQNHLYLVFPPSQYARTHPEYYPLIDGQRWIPEEGYRYWRPCESNPEVIRLTVEAARRFFDLHPENDSFSLGMDDVSHLCGCAQCRALDPHPDSYARREFSDRHYWFVNTVAREVARTHPGRYIGTLIYDVARRPPLKMERLEDNVFGFITEVSAQWCLPGREQEDHQLSREWARRCRHLSRYDYFGLGTFTPRYYPHAMAEQIRFDKALGFEGMFSELNTFLPHTAPMIWAFAKLEWDASLNIDTLLGEFINRMFGRAAPAMSRYFEHLESAWNHPPPGRTNWEHRNLLMQALAISPAAVDQGLSLLDQAAAQADQETVRRRIDTVRAALQYAGYAIREHALSEKIIAVAVTNAAQADTVLTDSLQLFRLSAEREPFWTAALQRDDLLGQNLRGLNAKNYLMIGRARTLERGAVIGALRVLDWHAARNPAGLKAIQAKLAHAGGNLSDLLRAWLAVRDQGATNLLTNPGFEQAAPVDASTLTNGIAASSFVPPAGWSTYSLSLGAQLWTATNGGHSQPLSVCLSNAHSACFLQTLPARPGEQYLCAAYACALPDGEEGKGYLAVRFQKPDGSWHPRTDLEPQVTMIAQPGWQPLLALVTIPEGAGRLVLLLGAKDQPHGMTVRFDDAAVYRVRGESQEAKEPSP